MKEIKETDDRLNYTDVISIAICLIPQGRLRANSPLWHETFKELKDDKSTKGLLAGLEFDLRDPYPPVSEQLDKVLSMMRTSGIMEIGSPSYTFYYPNEIAKQSVLSRYNDILKKHGEAIRYISDALALYFLERS